MKHFLQLLAGTIIRGHRSKVIRRFRMFVAMTVVFATVYALILPAIAVEKNTAATMAGMSGSSANDKDGNTLSCHFAVHKHTDACYEEQPVLDGNGNPTGKTQKVLICGKADWVIHEHDANCYQNVTKQVMKDGKEETVTEKVLVCTLPEIKEHKHTKDCYTTENVLTCAKEETDGHKHTDSCYQVENELVCGKEEHVHTDACYSDVVVSSKQVLTCGYEEGEEISPAEYSDPVIDEETGEVIEEAQLISEAVIHHHNDSCYRTEEQTERQLTCGMKEHTHSGKCYKETKTLICGQEESPAHHHSDKCYTEKKVLTCGELELHTHTIDCYEKGPDGESPEKMGWVHYEKDENGQKVLVGDPKHLICGKTELLAHQHGEACLEAAEDGNTNTEAGESNAGAEEASAEDGDASVDGENAASGENVAAEDGNEKTDWIYLDPENEEADGKEADSNSEDTDANSEDTDTAEEDSAEAESYPRTAVVPVEGAPYSLTVTYDKESSIPENAVFNAVAVTEAHSDFEVYKDKAFSAVEENINEDGSRISHAEKMLGLFDLTIFDEDGSIIEPAAPVSVTINFEDTVKENDEDGIYAVHFPETSLQEGSGASDDSAQAGQNGQTLAEELTAKLRQSGLFSEQAEIKNARTEVIGTESQEANEVCFEAGSFSVYAIVYTVDFRWEVDGETFEYSLAGGDSVSFRSLAGLLHVVDEDLPEHEESGADGITRFMEDIKEVRFSDESLVKVARITEETTVGALKEKLGLECEYSAELTKAQREAADRKAFQAPDWVLISVKAFDTEEYLTVEMKNGESFRIKVTDAQIQKEYISESGATYDITVTYGDDAEIPDGADLKVEEISKGTIAYYQYLSDTARKLRMDTGALSFARFFDIAIIDKDGEEVEPKAAVRVEIRYKEAAEVGEGEDVSVVHFGDEGAEVIETAVSGENWQFEADSFSVYGTIVAEASGDLSGRTFTISKGGNYLTTQLEQGTDAGSFNHTMQFKKDPDPATAAVWELEAVPDSGQYYIFTYIDGVKKYMSLSPNPANTNRANAGLSDTPQAFTFSKNADDGTYKFITNVNGQNYWLNEDQNQIGYAGWHAASSGTNDRFDINFSQPVLTNDEEYMVLVKIEDKYYIVLNNGELQEAENPVNGDINTVAVETPMLWKYNGSVLYHEAKEVAFNMRQVASDYYYRYIDPRSDDGLAMDDDTNTTQRDVPLNYYNQWGGKEVTSRNLMTQAAIVYANHTISSASDSSKVLKVIEENGVLKIAGGGSEGDAAEVYLARLTDYNNLKIGAKYHAVDHIDISVQGNAAVNAPLAYGTYYYKENGQVKTLVVSKENPLTLSLSNSDVEITKEDIKNGTIVAYTKGEDGSVNEIDNAFVILGFSGNAEADSGAGHSKAQVRIDGTFKVADLPPVTNGDGNDDSSIRTQRLANRIYYAFTTAKEVPFELKYNGCPLYASAEAAEAGSSDNVLTMTSTISMSNSFDYWDSRNECPGIWLLPGNSDRWKNGEILCSTIRDMNQGNSGMDFSLGSAADATSNTLALEITKYVVDTNGNAITPNRKVENVFHVYQKAIDKNGTPNPADEVKDLNVDAYDAEATQPDYTTGYVKSLDKNIVVGDGGIGAVYDYDVDAGMIYIEEDTKPKNLPRTITDENGRKWDYKETHFETEYVWRNDGIEERRHFSKSYDLSSGERYYSIPEILGDYKDVTGIDRFNGFLEFYVYNVYEPEPTDVKVEKVWKTPEGHTTDAPAGASVAVTLGRYKLIDDPDNPVTGDLIIRQTVNGEAAGIGAFDATYKVKQGDTVVRTGRYDPQTGGAVITGLPGGAYTVEISSSAEGYDVTNTPASNPVTIINGHKVENDNAAEISFTSTLTQKAVQKTVAVSVTNTISGAGTYQNMGYTFPGGSQIVVNITRPGPAHNINITVSPKSNGTPVSYTYQKPEGTGYGSVTQNLYFTLPAEGTYEVNIWHEWGQQDVWINSVSIYSAPGAGTNASSPMLLASRMVGNMSASPAGQNEQVPLTETTTPDSPIPGMKYVVDETWSTENDPVTVVLNQDVSWIREVPDLDAIDENGNKYLYFIKSATEQGVPDGTVMTIDMSGEKVLTSTGNAVLTVTNVVPPVHIEKSLEVEKIWAGDGNHPQEVQFTVSAATEEAGEYRPYNVAALRENGTDKVFTLNDGNSWHIEIDRLPVTTDDGKLIYYNVSEKPVAGYISQVQDLTTTAYNYCNVDVMKFWPDDDTHTEELSVRLRNSEGKYYAGKDGNGEAVFGTAAEAQTFTLNHSNQYTSEVKHLPYDQYTVEPAVEGQDELYENLIANRRSTIEFLIKNVPEGGEVDPEGPSENPEIHKRIDALRDGKVNPDAPHSGEDLTDLYRLYLDYTVNSLQEANGVDLLFIIDHSGSMNSNYYQGNQHRARAVEEALNGSDGVIADFLEMGETGNGSNKNRWAAVGFKGPYGRNYRSLLGWENDYRSPNAGETDSEILSGNDYAWKTSESNIQLPLEGEGTYYDPRNGWVPYGASVLTDYTAGFWRAEQFLLQSDTKTNGKKKVIVFISDGIPTLHIPGLDQNESLVGADSLNGSKYYSDDEGGCPDQTKTEFGYFVNDMEELGGYTFGEDIELYTVGFGGSMGTGTTGETLLKDLLNIAYGDTSREGTNYMAIQDISGTGSYNNTASEKLKEDLRTIMGMNETFTNIIIRDDLSRYVDLYGLAAAGSDTAAIMRAANAKVTMTVPDPQHAGQTQTITLYENGAPVNADSAKFIREDGTTKANIITELRYNPSSKTVETVFDPEYQAAAGVTYTLSFDVKTTDAAYSAYAAGGYDKYTTGSKEGQVITGGDDTDYLGTNPANATSTGKPGFRSNDEASASYKHNETEESKEYPHPVIQVFNAEIRLLKTDQVGTPLENAEFALYRDAYDSSGTEAAQTANAANLVKSKLKSSLKGESPNQVAEISVEKLKPGTYYLVETKAPDGYIQIDPIKIVVAVQTTVTAAGTTDTINVTASVGNTPIGANKLYKNENQWILEVMNTNGAALPNTGGPGIRLLYLFGITLIGLAGLGFVIKRRQRNAA